MINRIYHGGAGNGRSGFDAVGTGEVNTGANVGAGAGVFRDKTGTTLNFKSLVAGAGISLTPAADDITINSTVIPGQSNTASNKGAGAGVFKSKVGVDLGFKSLVAGAGVTITPATDEITLAASVAPAEVLSVPSFHDDFKTTKPFWATTEALTSADWQINTGTGKLDGIAENNASDWIRRCIEGDIDVQIKVERGTATSAGIILQGNGYTLRISRTATGLFITATGESDSSPAVGSDTMWLRIRSEDNGNAYFYWKVADSDPWTLQVSYSGKYLANQKLLYLDSANGGYVQEILIYDNGADIPVRSKGPAFITLTDAATVTLDASAGNFFRLTIGGNRTLANPTGTGICDGTKIIIRVTQDGTGGRTLAYDTQYRFSTDLPSPTLSTGIGDVDYLGFIYNEPENKWDFVGKVFGF